MTLCCETLLQLFQVAEVKEQLHQQLVQVEAQLSAQKKVILRKKELRNRMSMNGSGKRDSFGRVELYDGGTTGWTSKRADGSDRRCHRFGHSSLEGATPTDTWMVREASDGEQDWNVDERAD